MAGAVIVHPQMQTRLPSGTIPIVTTSTYEAWARVTALFHLLLKPAPKSVLVVVSGRSSPSALATIDRGSARDTIIGAGMRIDNLVPIDITCNLAAAAATLTAESG
jgi:UDP-3-O-[3-hydroxymyristoyl] glucosamine N-acyltransferase